MSMTNTKAGYGWIAIALHWISAIGVPLLLWVDVKKGEETRAAFDSLELPLGQSSENLNE